VRALLNLLRKNYATVQGRMAPTVRRLMHEGSKLKILHPIWGDEDLIKRWAAETVKLRI
jgi:hypothetical protein